MCPDLLFSNWKIKLRTCPDIYFEIKKEKSGLDYDIKIINFVSPDCYLSIDK